MELVKTQEIAVKEKTVTFTAWNFTQDEKDRLKDVLSKYPGEKVAAFISDLEMICLCAKDFLNERNVTFNRSEKKRMLGRFEKAEKELYRLTDKLVPIMERKNIFDGSIYSDGPAVLEKQRLHYLVLAAATQLKEIIQLVKDENRKPGRPSADAKTGDLVKIIASGFSNFFETPTSYESGPFYALIQIVFEACGLPCEDPSRHILAALTTPA